MALLSPENFPEDAYPLVSCSSDFVPPKGTAGALIQIRVGDLIRVTSSLTAPMYYGFLEGESRDGSGWFPKRHVDLVEDPLADAEEDDLLRPTADLEPPPLPAVPPRLLRRAAAMAQ